MRAGFRRAACRAPPLGGPVVPAWDGRNTRTSRAMRELIAARVVGRLIADDDAPKLKPTQAMVHCGQVLFVSVRQPAHGLA